MDGQIRWLKVKNDTLFGMEGVPYIHVDLILGCTNVPNSSDLNAIYAARGFFNNYNSLSRRE
jgi:vancomycin permeability regulator SanA